MTSDTPVTQGTKLNQLMSRTGSFPISIALKLLGNLTPGQRVLLDPFCGKGTTLLAGRILGYRTLGVDVAPEAVACSAAKLVSPPYAALTEYISSLPVDGVDEELPADVALFFSASTTRQLMAARRRILADVTSNDSETAQCAIFARALALGVLHGRSSISLSLPSAHAYSMSPTYVRRYSRDHNLVAPYRDVRKCLRDKLDRCWEGSLPLASGAALEGDAGQLESLLPNEVGGVDVILTSPPYLDAQTYAKDNWLRHWFLGRSTAEIKSRYLHTGSPARYVELMSVVIASMSRMLRPGGLLICVVGDVPKRDRNGQTVLVQTGELLAKAAVASQGGLILEHLETHLVPSHSRYFHELSGSNGHVKRQLVERVLVARRAD